MKILGAVLIVTAFMLILITITSAVCVGVIWLIFKFTRLKG